MFARSCPLIVFVCLFVMCIVSGLRISCMLSCVIYVLCVRVGCVVSGACSFLNVMLGLSLVVL